LQAGHWQATGRFGPQRRAGDVITAAKRGKYDRERWPRCLPPIHRHLPLSNDRNLVLRRREGKVRTAMTTLRRQTRQEANTH